jgi:hypothetical protein
VKDRYIYNARKDPIASFRPEYLAKCYHIEKGSKKLDRKLLSEFEYTPKDLCFPNGTGPTNNSNTDPKEDTPQVP